MKTFLKISIVIATFNSEKTLSKTLESVKKQDYPKNKVEILVIDGGSTDSTKRIAKKFGCKFINNPYRDPVPAKHIGYLKAKGKYIIYLDSDEVIENPRSLKLKIRIFSKNPQIKAVIPSGYKKPSGTSSINYYINEFGDPFSFFIYRLSKDARYFISSLKKRYNLEWEDKDCVVFDFNKVSPLPIFELIAMSSMIDLQYLKSEFFNIKGRPEMVAHFFYLLNARSNLLAISKRDYITHYSSDTFRKFLKKINSRIKNNIYHTTMGEGGFLGRDKFQPFWFRLKKYFFIPYSFSVFFPLVDSIHLTISRKNYIFLIHPLLCIYTSCLIIYYYSLKGLGVKFQTKGYGQ